MPSGQQEHERKQIHEDSDGEATEEIAWQRSAEDDKEHGEKCGNHEEDDLRRSLVWASSAVFMRPNYDSTKVCFVCFGLLLTD